MIDIPKSDRNGYSVINRKFRELIEFFNILEESLEDCENDTDRAHVFKTAQMELIMRGIL